MVVDAGEINAQTKGQIRDAFPYHNEEEITPGESVKQDERMKALLKSLENRQEVERMAVGWMVPVVRVLSNMSRQLRGESGEGSYLAGLRALAEEKNVPWDPPEVVKIPMDKMDERNMRLVMDDDNIAQLIGQGGETKKFRRVNPAEMSKKEFYRTREGLAYEMKRSIDQARLTKDIQRDLVMEKAFAVGASIEDREDVDFWIPVDDEGQLEFLQPLLQEQMAGKFALGAEFDTRDVSFDAGKITKEYGLWDLYETTLVDGFQNSLNNLYGKIVA